MRITFSLVRSLKAINQDYCQMLHDDELPQLLGYFSLQLAQKANSWYIMYRGFEGAHAGILCIVQFTSS